MLKCSKIKYFYIVIFSIALFLNSGRATAAIPSKEKIITVAGNAWPPFNNYPDQKKPGYLIEIVKEIFKNNGYKMQYIEYPWERAIKESKVGDVNALVGLLRTDSPEMVFPGEEIGTTRNGFYTRKDSKWTYTGINSLKRIRLGVFKGQSYGAELDAYIQQNSANVNRIDFVSGLEYLQRNLKRVAMKRIDATIDDISVLKATAADMHMTGSFREAGYIKTKLSVYIAFSPNYADAKQMSKMVSDGVITLRKNGTLEKILAKYDVNDWK
jgi:polar amino acid transport system substrate-binding protein